MDSTTSELLEQIQKSADTVRRLKASNAGVSEVTEAIQKLLDLKLEYNQLTGKPISKEQLLKPTKTEESKLIDQIKETADNIRQLQINQDTTKAKEELIKLLGLYLEYRKLTGESYPYEKLLNFKLITSDEE